MADNVFVLPNDPTAPFYEFATTLDGVAYRFRFKFNARDSAWYFDLYDAIAGTLLRAGLRVVTGWDPLRLFQGDGKPTGNLIVISQGANDIEADAVEKLGNDVLITYVGET
jgi:hypothetical protein